MNADPFGFKCKLTEKPHQATVCLRFQQIKCDILLAQCDLSILTTYILFIFSVVKSNGLFSVQGSGGEAIPLVCILLMLVLYVGIYWYNTKRKIIVPLHSRYVTNSQLNIQKRLYCVRINLLILNGTILLTWLAFLYASYQSDIKIFNSLPLVGVILYLWGIALPLRLLTYRNQTEIVERGL